MGNAPTVSSNVDCVADFIVTSWFESLKGRSRNVPGFDGGLLLEILGRYLAGDDELCGAKFGCSPASFSFCITDVHDD